MAINLAKKYEKSLATLYTKNSALAGKTSGKYSFVGYKSVRIPSIVTQALTDYQRNGTSRYGTPKDLQDTEQELTMTQDKGFSIVIDKGDNSEQQMMKNAGSVLNQEYREQVVPTIDKYAFKEWAWNAGKTIPYSAAVSKSNIITMLLEIEREMEDGAIPENDRYVLVKNTHMNFIKQSDEFQYVDKVRDEMIIKGVVGKIGTLNIISRPSTHFAVNVEHVAFQKESVILAQKIRDMHVHQDPPGISGHLLEGRFNYDAFVLGVNPAGCIVCVANTFKAVTPAVTKGATTTIASTTNGATIKYTLDGTDPRYSTTAVMYSAAIDNPVAGIALRAVAYNKASGHYMSDVLEHICV